MYRTVVVIPCYNEAARLKSEEFIAAIAAYPSVQFLFVDDGSKDGTDRVSKRSLPAIASACTV